MKHRRLKSRSDVGKSLSIRRCALHGYFSICIDDEDDCGVRVTPSKCCGRWDLVKSWTLDDRGWKELAELAECAAEETTREQGFAEAQAAAVDAIRTHPVYTDGLKSQIEMQATRDRACIALIRQLKFGDSSPLERMLAEAKLRGLRFAHDQLRDGHEQDPSIRNPKCCLIQRYIAELEAKLKEKK